MLHYLSTEEVDRLAKRLSYTPDGNMTVARCKAVQMLVPGTGLSIANDWVLEQTWKGKA